MSVFLSEKTLKVEVSPGTSLDAAITEAINLSNSNQMKVSFEFNGIELSIDKDTKPQDVYMTWAQKVEAERIGYENSPRYVAMKEQAERNKQDAQNNLNQLASTMDSVEFADLEQAIPYLSQVVKNSDIIGTQFDHGRLNFKLKESGYVEGMNVGKIDENDKDSLGKWLVGQYMRGGHPSMAAYMDQWKEKFVKQEQK